MMSDEAPYNSGAHVQGRLWAVEMPGFVPNLRAPEPNMDPIGRVVVLEDTDIRREWGQAGTSVDAAAVAGVRALTAGRTRPWTNEELLRLAPGGRGGQRP